MMTGTLVAQPASFVFVFGNVQHVRIAAEAAEYEVAVLAVGPYMPAYAAVDKNVQGFHGSPVSSDWPGTRIRIPGVGLRDRLSARGEVSRGGLSDLERLVLQYARMRERVLRYGSRPFLVLIEQVKVGTGAGIDEQWLDVAGGHAPLHMPVVCKVIGGVPIDVGVDVFGGLLPVDVETLH